MKPSDPRYDDHLTPIVAEGDLVWAVYGYDDPEVRHVPILEVEQIMVYRRFGPNGETLPTHRADMPDDVSWDDRSKYLIEGSRLVLARYGYWIPDGGGGISEPGSDWFFTQDEALQEAANRRAHEASYASGGDPDTAPHP